MSSPKRTGEELESIKQPQKVKVLILSESRASLKDFYLIVSFVKLIKIDLSYNKLSSFPPGFSFKSFTQLRTLFLHYNKFSAIKQLLPVTESQSLHYLTLFGNPLEEAKARHFFVNQMQTLMLMDDKPVRLDERNPDFSLRERTVPLLTFPLVATPSGEQSQIYIEMLIQELVVARKMFLWANPIVHIQRWWRHYLRKGHRKWKNTVLKRQPSDPPLQSHSSLQEYKQSLHELQKDDVTDVQSIQKIRWLLMANRAFWKCVESIIQTSRVFLSREYCQLRGIHFEQIPMITIRRFGNITGSSIANNRRLPLLQEWHHQLIVKSHPLPKKKENVKQISLKASEEYKINRNKLTYLQQKLIKREESYNHFVLPLLSKHQLIEIVKKQYWRMIRTVLREAYCEMPFLLEGLAKRMIAAVAIQRRWRGWKVRKSVNAFLKKKEKESAIKIQRWVRRLPFIHRHKFLLEAAQYLKTQKYSVQITLQMSQLEAIQSYVTYKENNSHNFAIPFQQNGFTITRHAPGHIFFHSPRKPYLPYLNLTFDAGQQEGKSGVSSILQVLFKQVKEVNKITDSKGVRFVRLGYQSVEEAQNRKFILALKTYRMLNHQFIRSREPPIVPPQYVIDIVAEINQNRLISIVYDKEERQELVKQPLQVSIRQQQQRRSQITVGSELGMLGGCVSLRIKYYIMKTDCSCTLLLREPNYQRQQRHPMQLQLNQFYIPRKSSRRYALDESHDIPSKISRNILSLQEFNPSISVRRQSGGYLQILSTEQSHTNLQEAPEGSIKRMQSYRKSQSYDRFDKQVYPPMTDIRQSRGWEEGREWLKQKRQKIQEIKAAHKKNIHSISLQKTQNLSKLRRSLRKESQERLRSIDDNRTLLEQQKARKHDRVREHFKASPPSSFEKDFLKKGMSSIKKGFRDYQKHRSLRNPLPQPSASPLKTQIKEFSLSFDPQKPTKDIMKKEIQEYNHSHPATKSQVTQAAIKQESIQETPPNEKVENEETKAKDEERKKLRKKRLVHSVFPEEFYPIRQANQIGFQLPKINQK